MPRYWETWEQRQKENTFGISFKIGLSPLKRLFRRIFLKEFSFFKTENLKKLKEKRKDLKKVMGKTFSGEEEQHERH